MPKQSFRSAVEQRFGKFPDFLIYYTLEWIIMIMLFVAGILAIISDYFAEFCEIRIPCLLCSKIDKVLVHRNPDFYYENSVCQAHKEDMSSSLAFCHMHKKLSDIRDMCEGCLVWFTVEKERSGFVGDESKYFRRSASVEQSCHRSEKETCSCCGESLRLRAPKTFKQVLSLKAPASTPRAPLLANNYKEVNTFEQETNRELLLQDEPAAQNADNKGYTGTLIDDTVPLVAHSEDIKEDASRSPGSASGNDSFDIAQPSPRWGNRSSKELPMDKGDFAEEPHEGNSLNSKSLMALYMELEEERNASAVAANNAMAMITRLQGEKAAVQMEALQYQRMMEEQAQYDQEALQLLQDMLLRKESDLKALESELLTYRETYGHVKSIGSEICEVDADDYYQEMKSQSHSPSSEKSDCESSFGGDHNEPGCPDERSMDEYENESCCDFEGGRSFVSSLLDDLEKRLTMPLSDQEPNCETPDGCRGNGEILDSLKREASSVREQLGKIEADQTSEGIKVLNEMAKHIRKLSSTFESATDA